jgi:catechol 2,3-dioxygenase
MSSERASQRRRAWCPYADEFHSLPIVGRFPGEGPGAYPCGMQPNWFASVALTELVLRVDDPGRVSGFYESVLGLRSAVLDDGRTGLFSGVVAPLVVLTDGSAAPRPRAAAGLFHVAFLYGDRPALAAALRRVIGAGVPIGSADHGVSEAIYLSDPEGNGIELYVDRPGDQWPPRQPDGQVAMVTEPLDLDALLAVAAERPAPPARIGHIHLSVADLLHAEQFYGDVLGFAVTQRTYPGALFLARDGYHHHLGANTWRSNRPAVPGAPGLERFTIRLLELDDLERASAKMTAAGHPFERTEATIDTRDLDGIGVRIVCS